MSNYRDIFAESILGAQPKGFLLPDSINALVQARDVAARNASGFPISDPRIDEVWGGNIPSSAPHNYFDYYFSGQDIRAYVDGTASDADFATLPIVQLGYKITQQKQGVYGFWSYTYDAVMRGSRIINGQITIATKAPDYMRRLLSKAAETRAKTGTGSYTYGKGLTEDDSNIDKYWGKNVDPAILSTGKNIFSIHPPFSLVIIYGVQSVSVNPNYQLNRRATYDNYQLDDALLQDTNERLVDSDSTDNASRIILDACELTDMSTGYGPDGQVISETYGFFARDMIIPSRTNGDVVNGMTQLPSPR